MATSRWIRLSSICISKRSALSSALSGSSSSSTRGRTISARASATRCFWPPESCRGLRFSKPVQTHQFQRLDHPAFGLVGARCGAPSTRRRRCRTPSCWETARSSGTSCRRRVFRPAGRCTGLVADAAPRPASGKLKPGDDPQKGRFAAAGRAEQGVQTAVGKHRCGNIDSAPGTDRYTSLLARSTTSTCAISV